MRSKSLKLSLFSLATILVVMGFVHFTTADDDIVEPTRVEAEPIPAPLTIVKEEEKVEEEIVIEEVEEVQVVEEVEITNRWNISLTEEEVEMLAKIVFLEAHTQSEDGVLAVIEVVFNRMISDDFPNTLEGVLGQTEPCLQFVTWEFIEKGKPTEKEYDMIYAALNGEREVLSTDYLFFGRAKHNNNDPIQIEEHWFCKGFYY